MGTRGNAIPLRPNGSGSVYYLSPRGGGLDDGPSITAALRRYAVVQMKPRAAWTVATPVNPPLGLQAKLLGGGGTIRSTLPDSGLGPGGYASSVFYGVATPTAVAHNALLTAASAPRGFVLLMDHALPVAGAGQPHTRFLVSGGTSNVIQQFTVRQVSGPVGGVYTVVTWEPIEYTFPIGAQVYTVDVPMFEFDGEGATISGTGDRAWEMSAGWRCALRNVALDARYGQFSSIACSMDVGSLDATIERVVIDGASVLAGIALECNINGLIDNCDVGNVGAAGAACGYFMPSVRGCELRNSRAYQCNIGAYLLEGSVTDTESARRSEVTGGSFTDCVANGILIAGAARDIRIVGCNVNGNLSHGIQLADGSGSKPTNIKLVSVTSSNNGGDGLRVDAGCELRAWDVQTDGNTGYGIRNGGYASIWGWRVEVPNVANQFAVDATATETFVGGDSDVTSTNKVVFDINNSSTVRVEKLIGRLGATGILCDFQSGVGTLALGEDVKTTGGNFGIYMGHGNACHLARANDVDLSSCATPYVVTAPATKNFGTVVLTAGVGSHPWPLVSASSLAPVVDRISTAQGAVGAGGIVVTIVPGVGITITSINLAGATVATDESTFAVWLP